MESINPGIPWDDQRKYVCSCGIVILDNIHPHAETHRIVCKQCIDANPGLEFHPENYGVRYFAGHVPAENIAKLIAKPHTTVHTYGGWMQSQEWGRPVMILTYDIPWHPDSYFRTRHRQMYGKEPVFKMTFATLL